MDPPSAEDGSEIIEILQGTPLTYRCKIGGHQFKTRDHQKYHQYCNGGDKPFTCGHCGKGIISRGHFEDHVKRHKGELAHPCPSCPQKFVNFSDLKRHARMHVGGPRYPCDHCDKSFTSAQTLKEHLLTHSGERPFPCPHCSKSFHRRSIYTKHLRTHTGERPYLCPTCGKCFAQKWTYDLHLVTHLDELPFSCDDCSREFGTRRNLLRHKYLHRNERKYTCEFCGMSFKRKDNLDRHLKTMHRDGNGTGSDETCQVDANKPNIILSKKRKKHKFSSEDPQSLFDFLSRSSISEVTRHVVIRDAVSNGLELLVIDQNGDTFLHKLCNSFSTGKLHKLVKLMTDLGKAEIFSVQNAVGEAPIHVAMEKVGPLSPATLRLLPDSFNWNARDVQGNTFLLLAVASSQTGEVLDQILQLGGDWTMTNLEGSSVLHLAVQSGNLEAVKYFCSLGADINWRDVRQETPLHRLRFLDQSFIEAISVLTKVGADINALEASGNNVLHLALVDGRKMEELEWLVGAGVDWAAKNISGQSFLHLAAGNGDVKAVEYFVALGGNVEDRDGDGRTPLHWAAFASKNFIGITRLLVEKGADVNALENKGNSVAHLATYSGRSREELEVLVKLGCSWKAVNSSGQSVLHMAAESGNVEAIRYFMSLGAEVNSRCVSGEAPINRAHLVMDNYNKTIKILVEYGADINAVDDLGNNVVHAAVIAGKSVQDLQYLVQLGCDRKLKSKCGHSVLHSAAQSGNFHAAQYFISLGADANEKDDLGVTPIVQLAFAKENFSETLKVFVESGADINAAGTDGNTLLLLSAKLGGRTKEEYELIVTGGGNLSAINGNGQSALHLAALTGNMEALQYLRFWGADVKARDSSGRTTLHCVLEGESGEIRDSVDFLLESGADINYVYGDGSNIALMAKATGRA